MVKMGASISAEKGETVIKIPKGSSQFLDIDSGKNYEVLKAQEGVYLLVEKTGDGGKSAETAGESTGETDGKIFSLLREKNLSERVEGNFEKFLGKDELKRFKELLDGEKIIKFKLSEKYRKAVYKFPESKKPEVMRKRESENANAGEKPLDEYSFAKDGFLVVKNEARAKKISMELSDEIKNGRVRGIKSFDGMFYIIENDLYEKYRPAMLQCIKEMGTAKIAEISSAIGISQTLARIVCEFLKEEGEILEKRKEVYRYVD